MSPFPTVVVLTRTEAEERRAEILRRVGDEDEFRRRAEEYSLGADELALFDRLEALDYLLDRR